MNGPLTADRIRAWLRDLSALTAERGRDEVEITRQYESRREAEQRAYREARTSIDRRCHADLRTLAEERAAEEKRLREQHRRDEAETRKAGEVERLTIAEKGEHSEKQVKRQWDETVWAAETVYEAQEHNPRKAWEKTRRTLEERKSQLEAMGVQAQVFLRRCRIGPDESAPAPADGPGDLDAACDEARARLERLLRTRGARLFQDLQPLFVLLLPPAAVATAIGFATEWKLGTPLVAATSGTFAVSAAALVWLYLRARSAARARHRALRLAVADGEAAFERALREAGRRLELDEAELVETRDREVAAARETYEPLLERIRQRRRHHLRRIDEQYPARIAGLRAAGEQALADAAARAETRRLEIERRHARESEEIEGGHARDSGQLETAHAAGWSALVRRWGEGLDRGRREAAAIAAETARLFPEWGAAGWGDWRPGDTAAPAVPFGRLTVDLAELEGGLPADERLVIEGPTRFEVPALLTFPDRCSLLLESGPDGRDAAMQTLQAVMMRLLTTLPPGKARFTIIDPIGLGRNFAGFMHLADYNEAFVGGRIWTETRHLEQRLADLTEHMENVIQKYLRNEYETIAQYNDAAGEIAEPYRFVVIADFPANFSDQAARRLASILSSGPRCGVYTLISLDVRQPLPRGITAAELTEHAVTLRHEGDRFAWADEDFRSLPLRLESPPPEAFVTGALKLVGESALDATRVEVPFEVVAPGEGEWWSRTADSEIRVPLGRCGATRLQHLLLGHGTNQHALIAGKTGSGKSTLLHVMITNLAAWYSPDEVEFYLVDFKKGVEFKTYATHRLPHARAVAVESDREFGLSVLQRLDEELRRRGDLFRERGVQDLAGYRRAVPDRPMPRTLLIIDEFQEFFVEDDKLAQDAALLLDRLVRQGRAFGVHVLLGSQTLGGAYTLARSTLGQMGVRIALQCSETDSYLILSDDNAAARLLARPGEAIYNDANGQVEGNSPFQIVWLPDAVRDSYLDRAAGVAADRDGGPREPCIVFEGSAPADPAGNHLLAARLRGRGAAAGDPTAWLGEAVAIKDPTAVQFARQSGSNLLVVGQREEAALGMMTVALLSLAAGGRPLGSRLYVLDGTPADSPVGRPVAELAKELGPGVRLVEWRDVESALAEVSDELARRQGDGEGPSPPVFVLINQLQRYRVLRRREDDFSFSFSGSGEDGSPPAGADRRLAELLREGPAHGLHVLAWCDSLANLERTFDRQVLREFDHRVLLQMSAADSTSLIDSALASKLGMQRALLANEERGTLEKFRPYAVPRPEWIESAVESLAAIDSPAPPAAS